MVFSFKPPIAMTLPRMEISPVMAMSRRTGAPVRAETNAVQMVMPADGSVLGNRALREVYMDVLGFIEVRRNAVALPRLERI